MAKQNLLVCKVLQFQPIKQRQQSHNLGDIDMTSDPRQPLPHGQQGGDAPQDVSTAIDKKVGEVRIDGLDMSFGELLSLHESQELIIQPEYQRLFRWSPEQQSRLIESVLLSLPIPQLFVIENDNGKLELIDGLQRISSIIHF